MIKLTAPAWEADHDRPVPAASDTVSNPLSVVYASMLASWEMEKDRAHGDPAVARDVLDRKIGQVDND